MLNQDLPESETLFGVTLVQGAAEGPVLASAVGLSFWGGIDPVTGKVIDHHHPLCHECVTGKILAIPSGRGSCSGSGVILELLLNGTNPAALVFEYEEHILPLGVIVTHEVFGKSIPCIQLSSNDFQTLSKATWAKIDGNQVVLGTVKGVPTAQVSIELFDLKKVLGDIELNAVDLSLLDGSNGRGPQVAQRVILRMAALQGASELINVTKAHIDGCVYTGPGTLSFAERFCSWNAKVCIPTTMNSVSVDMRRWKLHGTDPAIAEPSSRLAEAYVKMGARPTFTCAPYQLDGAPQKGEQIVWAESNAVVYANSVLGARTTKYPDYLDLCIALTGRAPNTGCHVTANRIAKILFSVNMSGPIDDSFFPLLGYYVGGISRTEIPIIHGLEDTAVSRDDLKAFGAAFATTSGASMFHIAGVTPEACSEEELSLHRASVQSTHTIEFVDLRPTWTELNSSLSTNIDLISLGNPHLSADEFTQLAACCQGRTKSSRVSLIMTCGRDVYQKAYNNGSIEILEIFGAQIITDTCWCMIGEPIIKATVECIMTNSAKYAHYGTGLTGRRMRFGSLSECVDAACTGQTIRSVPVWLSR